VFISLNLAFTPLVVNPLSAFAGFSLPASPQLTITNPQDYSMVDGQITVAAALTSGFFRAGYVQLYVDDQLIGNVVKQPYQWSWTGTAGSHRLVAKAYDEVDNILVSPTVHVTVADNRDTIPPTVFIISPNSGATLSGVANIFTNANDAGGIARVDFLGCRDRRRSCLILIRGRQLPSRMVRTR
jgi:hypothetical protein